VINQIELLNIPDKIKDRYFSANNGFREVVMKVKSIMMLGICVMLLSAQLSCTLDSSAEKNRFRWAVHDMSRPRPPIVTPGEEPGQPPSNAVILFDGKDLSQWVCAKDGGPAKWKVKNGYMEVVKKAGNICTKQAFGNCQLHIEWASPANAGRGGQHSGNSGVFLMSTYEVQVLNSYNNKTYADGQAAALYGQHPPLVNASRPPGQWQSYDIIFHRPKFDKDGKVICPGRVTMLHNGIVVQDNAELYGASTHGRRATYHPHDDKLPLLLQDHGDPIRFRNIWLVELPE